jgi:sugar lactone lactonase YvrE
MNSKAFLATWFALAVIPAAHASYAFTNFAGVPGGSGNADGTGVAARFNYPNGVAADSSGNVYIADTQNHTIRKMTLAGVVETIAGSPGVIGSADGVGSAARFYAPTGVAFNAAGSIFVADYGNSTIRKLTPTLKGWMVTTLAGTAGVTGKTDGTGAKALFSDPSGVALDGVGNVYVADTGNPAIRKISPGGVVSTLVGNLTYISKSNGLTVSNFYAIAAPQGVAVDAVGNIFYTDSGGGAIAAGVYKVTPAGAVSLYENVNSPRGLALDSAGNVYVTSLGSPTVSKFTAPLSGATQIGAGFSNPLGVAVDEKNNVFVADTGNHIIRQIASSDGSTIALAGSSAVTGAASGTGTGATFNNPEGLVVDSTGDIYVADTDNQEIRIITPFALTTILAGTGAVGAVNGPGMNAVFDAPKGVAVDTSGNVYVADFGFDRVQKITPAGKVTTLAIGLNNPNAMAIDASGNLYVVVAPQVNAANANPSVEVISPQGNVTPLTSPPAAAGAGVAIDGSGNVYTVTNNVILKAAPNAAVTLLVTNTFPLNNPTGLAVDSAGNVYVADTGNNRIVQVAPTGFATNIAGTNTLQAGHTNGVGTNALFNGPTGVAVDGGGNLYIADKGNNTIRMMTPSTPFATNASWTVSTIAGGGTNGNVAGTSNGLGTNAYFTSPLYVAVDSSLNLYLTEGNNLLRKLTKGPSGYTVSTLAGYTNSAGVGQTAPTATFNAPSGVAMDSAGNVFVADQGNSLIREISPGGVVTTLAGTGTIGSADGGTSIASFYYPAGVAVDASDNVYVADTYNHTIRKIAGGVVSTVAGNAGYNGSVDGTGSTALFWSPTGVAVDSAGNVYVADTFNNTIREITIATGAVTTLAGSPGLAGNTNGDGSLARFNHPTGLVVAASGAIYVADSYNQTIRSVVAATVKLKATWAVTTVGGTAGVIGGGYVDGFNGVGPGAEFDFPTGVALDAAGNLDVADAGNNRISVDLITQGDGFPSSGSGQPTDIGTGSAASSSIASGINLSPDLPSVTPKNGLILLANGSGTISHGSWPATLVNGKEYTVTAVPASGYVFAAWVGGTTGSGEELVSYSAQYTFTMQAGKVLEANFVPSPFLSAAGVYNGLFVNTNGVVDKESAGMLHSLTVSKSGTYSGTILLNGASHSITGSFDPTSGQAGAQVLKVSGGTVTVAMTLNLSGPPIQVNGTVSGSAWQSSLFGELATNSQSSQSYTMLVNSSPAGDGYASISSAKGVAKITGSLADGTAFSQSVPVSQSGDVPIYANLGSKGLLQGWINLNNSSAADLSRVQSSVSGGASTTSPTELSLWTDSPASLGLTSLTSLSILDTASGASATYDITTTAEGKVSGTSVEGSINPKNGLFTITIGTGASKVAGQGVILLDGPTGPVGGGYFLNGAKAGTITLQQ